MTKAHTVKVKCVSGGELKCYNRYFSVSLFYLCGHLQVRSVTHGNNELDTWYKDNTP